MNNLAVVEILARARAFAAPFVVLLLLPVGALALAQATPQDALGYTDPATAEAQYQIDQRQEDLSLLRQIDAAATAQPTVNYGDNLTNADPASVDASIDLSATVGYTYDYRGLVRTQIALTRAQADLATLLRHGHEAALRAQAQLLSSQVALERAQTAVDDATQNVADVQAQVDAGDATDLDLQNAQLNLQYQSLSLEQAQKGRSSAQADAASYGLADSATYVPVRFVLPDADVQTSSTYRQLQLQADLVQANMTRGTVFNAVQNLNVYGNYSTGDVNFSTQAGIIDSNPRAEISVDYPGGKNRWGVGVTAEIVLGTNLLDIPRYQHNLDAAQADAAAYPDQYAQRAADTLQAAQFAERTLALVEQEYDLRQQQNDAQQAALQQAQQAYDEATANGTQPAPRDVDRAYQLAQRDALRARDTLQRAEASVYSNYATYIRRVGDYLDVVESDWTLR